MAFTFLKAGDLNWSGVFGWAKKLIDDLNKAGISSQTVPAGMVAPFAGTTAPTGWLMCDGATYGQGTYPNLFLAIGYTYGGSDGNFSVPNMADRSLMGVGSIVALGDTAGASEVTLTTAQLPSHNHEVNDPGHTHTFTGAAHNHSITDPQHTHLGVVAATGTGLAGAGAGGSSGSTGAASTGITINDATAGGTNADANTSITIANTGSGEAVNVLNPVFGINYIIKV